MRDKRDSNRGDRIEGVRYVHGETTPGERMAAFDILPAPVRSALVEAPFNFDTLLVAKALRDGMPPRQMEIDLRLASIEFAEKGYAARGVPDAPRLARLQTRRR